MKNWGKNSILTGKSKYISYPNLSGSGFGFFKVRLWMFLNIIFLPKSRKFWQWKCLGSRIDGYYCLFMTVFTVNSDNVSDILIPFLHSLYMMWKSVRKQIGLQSEELKRLVLLYHLLEWVLRLKKICSPSVCYEVHIVSEVLHLK